MRRRLLEVGLQPQHAGQGLPAEADIDDPRPVGEIDLQQHVAALADVILGLAPQHPRETDRGAEADRDQRRPQQQVLLVAIAAAPALDQLALQRIQVQPRRLAAEGIEVLEGDRRRVPPHQRLQRPEVGRHRAVLADAAEIGVEIEAVGHGGSPPSTTARREESLT